MKTLERVALLVAACGGGVAWLMPYLLLNTPLPDWVASRWYLLVCLPALLSGLGALWRYAGFAKAPVVIFCVALVTLGELWTDPTERGRGALLAAVMLVPLPLAALIRKHDYLVPFIRAFSVSTAASMMYAMSSPATERFGRLVDPAGNSITNPNSVGTQAALSALFLLMIFPRRKGPGAYLFVFLTVFLTICCIITGCRTAFLALAGAFVVSMLLLNGPSAMKTMAQAGFVALAVLAVNGAVDQEHPFYQRIVERLIQDDEDTLNTLGGRTAIWRFAVEQFASDNVWIYGTGTGGVDKALGRSDEFTGATALGPDGIWRLSAHNTLVWWALAFGISGLAACAWLGFTFSRTAYRLDKKSGDWRRSTLVTFVALAGIGGVITQEGYWFVVEAVLLMMLSAGAPRFFPSRSFQPRLSHFEPEMPRALPVQ